MPSPTAYVAANIVVQMNKFCHKDGKGNLGGFTNFEDDKILPKGLVLR